MTQLPRLRGLWASLPAVFFSPNVSLTLIENSISLTIELPFMTSMALTMLNIGRWIALSKEISGSKEKTPPYPTGEKSRRKGWAAMRKAPFLFAIFLSFLESDNSSEYSSSPKTIISPTSVLISIPAINTRPVWSKETRISSAEKLSCSVIAIPSRPFSLIYPGNSHGSMRLSGEPFLVWTCRSRTRLIPLLPFKGCPPLF